MPSFWITAALNQRLKSIKLVYLPLGLELVLFYPLWRTHVQWSLFDVLIALKDAWERVKPATIKNCFRHCGFKSVKPNIDFDPSDDDLPLATITAALKISRENAVAPVTDEAIAEAIQAAASSDVQEEENEDESDPVTEIPTYAQMIHSLGVLRRGLVSIANLGPSVNIAWKGLAAVVSCLSQSHTRSFVQKPITDK